jgi:hypothetical protein
LDEELDEAQQESSSIVHGVEGWFFQPQTCASRRCDVDTPYFDQQYMLEMVEARRTSGETEQRYDLFSALLDASEDELDNGSALSDEDLIGKR